MRTLTLALLLIGAAPALAQGDRAPRPKVPADLRQYADANLLMHRQQHAKAYALLGRLLKDHPRSHLRVEALFWRSHCLEELNRTSEAIKAYQALIEAHPQSGWSVDAGRRVTALQALAKRSLRALPRKVALRRATVTLANGDRLSGRLRTRDGKVIELDVHGLSTPVRLPRGRVLTLDREGGRATALAYRLDPTQREQAIYSLLLDDGTVDDGKKGKTTTRVNKDGSKTITTVHEDGSKTITTITKDGDGRKVVVVRIKGSKKDGKLRHKIELKLDGKSLKNRTLDGALEDLPKRIKKELRKHLGGDLDLDLDLDLDGDLDLDELQKGLEGLPKRIRERIEKELRAPRLKMRKVFRFLDGKKGFDFTIPFFEDHHEKKRRVRIVKRRRVGPNWTGRLPGAKEHLYALHQAHDAGPVHDRVYLRNGDKISGELLKVDGAFVHMKTNYGEVKIKRESVRQIVFKRVPKPFLGISMGHAKGGVTLSQVHENTPAAAAGLKKGDVVTAVDGKAVKTPSELSEAIGAHKVGETLKLSVRRGDKTLTIEATLGKRSAHRTHEEYQFRAPRGEHGYRWVPRPPRPPHAPRAPRRLRKLFRVPRPARPHAPHAPRKGGQPFLGVALGPHKEGVLISGVQKGTSAARHGIKQGDVLTHFNGKRCTSIKAFVAEMRKCKVGQHVTLRLKRGEGNVLELKFPLEGAGAAKPDLRKLRKRLKERRKKALERDSSHAPHQRDF